MTKKQRKAKKRRLVKASKARAQAAPVCAFIKFEMHGTGVVINPPAHAV